AETRDELVVRLLRSSIAEGLGNEAEARRLVDDAITAYPEASRPYVVRATMLLQDPALVEDAVEDLTRAIELNPADLNAYRIRSLAYVQLNRMSDAVRDVLAAVEANPDNAELRIGAASRLIDLGRQDDAADVIDAGLERQGSSLQLLVSAGQMFAELGQPRRAVQYLEPAWEQTGDPAIAARLVGSLLEFPRPDVRRARQIAGSQRLSADDYRVLLMRASVESQAENTGELERLLTEAYRLVRDQGPELQAWASQLVALLGSGEAAVDYLRRLDRSERLSPWTRFSMARILAEEDDGRAESLRVLDRLVDGTRDSAVRLAAIRFRSLVHYDLEDYQRAADDMQRVLDVTPNDPDTLNNLAYTRAVHLGEADLAVPLAERVAELRPNNRGVLDTLGVVYLRAGRAADAISPLERALGVASSDLDRASVLIHLAEARLETGNTPGAENAAQEARAILAENPEASDALRDELDPILDEIRRR
ncbi:MAG: tetratricopeptide repeat protein, partial [Planctomycetota bacterium]